MIREDQPEPQPRPPHIMTTPKMTGMTPGSLGAPFTFPPALPGTSPAAGHHLLNKHRSPAPLQAGFSTPEALAAIGMVGGAGLTPGTSASLGIPQGMPPDESKKRELGEILRLLALRPGRISEEGVERLAKRMGLEFYTEIANGMTTMGLGGKVFLLDIDFKENQITRVALSFMNTPGPSPDLAHLADSILHRNLSPTLKNPKMRPPLISPSLAEFADNLEQLAKTDRLSCPPHLNCFTAITGIYRSLLKVFEHEKNTLDGGETTAMCKGNGRPRMHVRGKVGLSVEYWKEQRFVPTAAPEDKEPIYRVIIEVAEAPSDYALNPITPVRTSSHWVSDEIKKPSTDSLFGDPEDTVTDWLEPPLEELPDQAHNRPPLSRFIARLDPPVAVPFQDELHLFNSLMLAPPAGISVDTLEAQLFPTAPIPDTGRERRLHISSAASAESHLLGEDDESVRHRYKLYNTLKPVYARHIHEVPFSHPKELLNIFQILRQFALVGTLLRSCFSPSTQTTTTDPTPDSDEEDLDSFLASPGFEDGSGVLPVDITLVEHQALFTLAVIFPLRAGIANFVVEVARNADVRVVVDKEMGPNSIQALDGRGLERAVVVGEDLGMAVEWARWR